MEFTGDLLDNQLLKLLERCPDKCWDWDLISQNPNIMYNFLQKNIERHL